MRGKYESLALTDLKAIAKTRGIKGTSTMKKAEVIEAMLLEDEKDKAKGSEPAKSVTMPAQKTPSAGREPAKEEEKESAVKEEEKYPGDLDSGVEAHGILEVMPSGYGFIRCANYLPGENDVYVAPSQIRRFGLKTGDILRGNTRIKTQSEKFSALLFVKTINGYRPEILHRGKILKI